MTAQGRKDLVNSGYYRCFAKNKDDLLALNLARIFSRVHAKVIANGNSLDGYILTSPDFNRNNIFHTKTSRDAMEDGHYTKYKILKVHCSLIKNKKCVEVDYIVKSFNKILLFEIKDGDNFDTKKSTAEVTTLQCISNYFQQKYHTLQVEYYIVFWNATQKSKIAFKADCSRDMFLTGEEFCKIVGNIDFSAITQHRYEKSVENQEWILSELKKFINTENLQ